MKYNVVVKRQLRSVTKPPGFTMDVVDKGDHVTLRVYEDEIKNLTIQERIKAMEYLTTVEDILKANGITCYSEGASGGPRRI